MDPATINLALMGVEFLVKEVPVVAEEIKALLAKPNPTPEDWAAMRARVLTQTYETLVPNSQLNNPLPPV